MNRRWNKIYLYGLLSILIVGIVYFCISRPQMERKYYVEKFAGAESITTLGELTDNSVVTQAFICNADYIKGVTLRFANYGNIPSGKIEIVVENENTILTEQIVEAAQLPDSAEYYVNFNGMKPVKSGTPVVLIIRSLGGEPNAAVTLWASEAMPNCELRVNGEIRSKTIVMIPDEYLAYSYGLNYGFWILLLIMLWTGFCYIELQCEGKGKKNAGTEVADVFFRYRFLLSQLIGRDFKTKYRRSYLGILWSLLNPILMMIIVSAVFSFVFRFDIENFPVYLILGQITFSFFSEATQIATTTITGSGQLIKKVYLPKYIFPLSKVMFSFINFLITFIAVALVLCFYKIDLTINVLFLPLWLFEYFLFTLGISFFLAATMVFMRDTQYLYSIVILAWGYVTPIFYPVESLSPWMQEIMNLNPLYHYIRYLRDILLNGICPSLAQNIICCVLAIGSFLIGIHYFYKRQNKFILHI